MVTTKGLVTGKTLSLLVNTWLTYFIILTYASGQTDLTGVWKETGAEGKYYLRQVGNDLFWVGMSPDDGNSWTNVFTGKISGNVITGNWADIPKGKVFQNAGSLTLTISEDANKLSITQKTGGFGVNSIERIKATELAPQTTPPPTSPTPSKFVIRIDNIKVDEARSSFSDTVFVGLSTKVGDGQPITAKKFLGDLDDGANPSIGIDTGPIRIEDGQVLTFSYLVENKGGGGIEQTLIDVGKGAATFIGSPGLTVGIVAAEKLLPIIGLGGLVPGGCNGVVAADEIQYSREQLEDITATGPHTETRFYPGESSAGLCGTTSRYHVTWTILKG